MVPGTINLRNRGIYDTLLNINIERINVNSKNFL